MDGELLLELLVHHRDRLHALEQEDEPTRRLLMLVKQRRHWVEENKQHSNRLCVLGDSAVVAGSRAGDGPSPIGSDGKRQALPECS